MAILKFICHLQVLYPLDTLRLLQEKYTFPCFAGKVLIKLSGDEGFSLKLATATEAVLEEEFTSCRAV